MARVTQASLTRSTMANLQASLARTSRLQEQLATGKRVSRPSDSPTATITALRADSSAQRTTQHSRNIEHALERLRASESALQTVTNALQRVRDLAVQADNPALGPTGREAIALEIEQLRASVLQSANSQHGGTLLFAGTADVAAAYDATGAYLGNTADIERNVGDSQRVTINTPGAAAFGDGAGSVFAELDRLAADIRAGAEIGSTHLPTLDARLTTVLHRLSEGGARTSRLESLRAVAEDGLLSLRRTLSEATDVDIAETVMELQMQEVAYQAALSATSRVIQPSLVDWLR